MGFRDTDFRGSTMTIISCGLWLSVLLFVVYTVDRLFVKGMKLGVYRFFVGPAALVHDVSQVLACLLTGAQVKNVQLANAKGGRVEHEKPKIPGLGNLMIAVAPLLACGAVLIFMPTVFGIPLHIAPPLPTIVDITPDSLANTAHGLIDSCRGAVLYLANAHYSLTFAAFLYIGLIFTIGLTPDKGKLKYAIFFVILATITMHLADGAMNHAAENFAANVLWPTLSFAVPISLLFLGLALVLSAIHSAFKSKRKPYPLPKGAISTA